MAIKIFLLSTLLILSTSCIKTNKVITRNEVIKPKAETNVVETTMFEHEGQEFALVPLPQFQWMTLQVLENETNKLVRNDLIIEIGEMQKEHIRLIEIAKSLRKVDDKIILKEKLNHLGWFGIGIATGIAASVITAILIDQKRI